MKASPKQYALALASSLHDASPKASVEIINNFCRVLAVNNHLAWSEKIISEFGIAWDKAEGVVNADIISSVELDAKTLKFLEERILEKASAVKANIRHAIDRRLLGGVILKFGDKIWDASASSKLKRLREEMVK